jgi:FkbH-like protein
MHASVLDDLTARLAATPQSDAVVTAALTALAALDPAGAADWLLRHDPHLVAVPRRVLAAVLASLAEAINAPKGGLAREAALGILKRYGQLLSPDGALDFVSAARAAEVDPDLDDALAAALARAPEHPGLLRAAADLAVAAGAHERAHDLLTRLGRADSGLVTMRYVHAARSRLPASADPPIRIALLSSFTIDPVVPYLDLECRSLHLEPQVYVAPFNTWEREMLGHGSGLEQFEPQITFLSVAADDLLPGLVGPAVGSDLEVAGTAAVDRLLAAAARFCAWSSAILVVHGLHTAFQDPLGPAAGRDARSRSEIIGALNARLAEGLRGLPRAYLLDLQDVLTRRQRGTFDNPKMRHLARMRLSEGALVDVGHAYARYIAPAAGRTRKCVVLDLDNTLWGGIVGEDGPHGIRLGDTSPGSEYREFQEYLVTLTRRGILLAINSKNNPDDALEVIRGHEAMVLRETSFSAVRINWESKPNNMLSLAEELSIGLDSLVFVDDSEKERALMRQALPQVLTPEMPRDPALYRSTLEGLPELQVLAVTEEDRTRTQQYAERRQRADLRLATATLDDYLASLEIVALMGAASARTLPRVHQLFQRTNQFNLTGRRYDIGVLSARADDAGWRIYTAQVQDRFGDHGLVASALVQRAGEAWIIENFVMSCRVIGYGVEDALLGQVGADAWDDHARWLLGEFMTTAKNVPARDFYPRNGFVRDADGGEVERWRRDLAGGPPPLPSWITVRPANGA